MKTDLRVELLAIDDIIPDAGNPRTFCDDDSDAELEASIAKHDVKVPLIGYQTPDGVMLADGHRRLRLARKAGKNTVPVYILAKRPDEAELLAIQLTINGHRSQLNPLDLCISYERLLKLRGWTQAQLAAELAISAGEVTSTLSLAKLSAEHQQLVRERRIPKSAAYALTRLPEPERAEHVQKLLARELNRDQLNRKAQKKPSPNEPRSQRVSCQLPAACVSVRSAAGLTLSSLIDLLDELIRLCRKARSEGLDITTAVRVFRDRARGQTAT